MTIFDAFKDRRGFSLGVNLYINILPIKSEQSFIFSKEQKYSSLKLLYWPSCDKL
jgi:hypothetical protein